MHIFSRNTGLWVEYQTGSGSQNLLRGKLSEEKSSKAYSLLSSIHNLVHINKYWHLRESRTTGTISVNGILCPLSSLLSLFLFSSHLPSSSLSLLSICTNGTVLLIHTAWEAMDSSDDWHKEERAWEDRKGEERRVKGRKMMKESHGKERQERMSDEKVEIKGAKNEKVYVWEEIVERKESRVTREERNGQSENR